MQKFVTLYGNKVAEEDVKYFKEKPETGFSPEKNAATMARSIEKAKQAYIARRKKYDEELRIRTDAVTSYLKHLDQHGETPVEKYFGRKTLAELQGRHIQKTIYRAASGQKGAILNYSKDIIYD